MSEQQEQPQHGMVFPDGGVVGGNISTQMNPGLAAEILNSEEAIDRFIHFLRGEVPEFNEHNDLVGWKKPKLGLDGKYVEGREPVLNEQGVYEIQRYLNGLTSKIISVSQVDDKQWRDDLLSNVLSVYSTLFLNYRRYGLKPNKYELLCCELTNFTEYSFSKAKNQFMGKMIQPAIAPQEHVYTMRNQEQKKGMLGGFLNI